MTLSPSIFNSTSVSQMLQRLLEMSLRKFLMHKWIQNAFFHLKQTIRFETYL